MKAFIDKEIRALLGKFVRLAVSGMGYVEAGRAEGRIESVGVYCSEGDEPYVSVYVRWFSSDGKPDANTIRHNVESLVILERTDS